MKQPVILDKLNCFKIANNVTIGNKKKNLSSKCK